tara:strand:- start:89 stop:400 length:312 start_codon:yes stop_codon:yes gene_type:complete
MNRKFNSFKEFYPFYLSEHKNSMCRLLHFVGTLLVLLTTVFSSIYNLKFLFLAPFFGYGFAWIGHYFFEKNRPATFKYPIYSFFGDWVMFKDIIISKENIFNN